MEFVLPLLSIFCDFTKLLSVSIEIIVMQVKDFFF